MERLKDLSSLLARLVVSLAFKETFETVAGIEISRYHIIRVPRIIIVRHAKVVSKQHQTNAYISKPYRDKALVAPFHSQKFQDQHKCHQMSGGVVFNFSRSGKDVLPLHR